TGHPLDIEVKYSTDGGTTWLPPAGSASGATWDARHDSVTALSASPGGDIHTFVWNSFADLGGTDVLAPPGGQGVIVRVTSLEYGNSDETAPFALFNTRVVTVSGATLSGLNNPSDVILDGSGNVFISDTFNHKILMLNAQATSQVFMGVTVAPNSLGVVAGTTSSGFTGDNLPATSTALNFPQGIALDNASPPNLYVADSLNHRVRRIDGVTGYITTVAGTGFAGTGGDGGLATLAELNAPEDLAFDTSATPWNLWIADTGNNQIRVLNRSSGSITPFSVSVPAGALARISGAADGSSGFDGDGAPFSDPARLYDGPGGIDVDGSGNVYISDRENHVIRVANVTGSAVTVVGTSIASEDIATVLGAGLPGYNEAGPASVRFRRPGKLALDASGNIFFADTGNNCLRVAEAGGAGALQVGAVTIAQNYIETVAGRGLDPGDDVDQLMAWIQFPAAVALDGSSPQNVYFTDTASNRIRILNTEPPLGNPLTGVATDRGATMTVQPAQVSTVAGFPPTGLRFVDPRGMAFFGSTVYVADAARHQVLGFDLATRSITVVAGTGIAGVLVAGPADQSPLDSPNDVAVDSTGTFLVIADTVNAQVQMVNLGTAAATGYGTTLQPGDIGSIVTGQSSPMAVTIDTAGWATGGNQDDLYIAAAGNHRIRWTLMSDGSTSTVAGGGTGTYNVGQEGGSATNFGLGDPAGVTVLPSGLIVASDPVYQHLVAFTIGGTANTIAGTTNAGFNGDGLDPLVSDFNSPGHLLVESSGNLLIFDRQNHIIRRFVFGPPDTLNIVAGTIEAGFNGDGRPGVNTKINLPYSGAFDGSGNLYFSDSANQRIRRFRP
ncbi:MAG: NHL repeat-containing protein, partial [Planctomycetota bacterium]